MRVSKTSTTIYTEKSVRYTIEKSDKSIDKNEYVKADAEELTGRDMY